MNINELNSIVKKKFLKMFLYRILLFWIKPIYMQNTKLMKKTSFT